MIKKSKAPRRRIPKAAKIIFGDKAAKLECVARNVSEKGARLHVSTTLGLPKTFDAIIDGTRRRCRSIWRTDRILRVEFE